MITEKYNGFAIYSKDMQPIGIVSSTGELNAKCKINSIPKRFGTYLTSIEDKRFHQHTGIDIKGITRALYENIKARKIIQGGSTITQQLARNILRDKRRNVARKLKETSLALNIERKYSKTNILELYYNTVFWGKNIYGLRGASLEYFLKEPEQLSTSEQMILLALLRGPNYYLNHFDKLNKRYHFLNTSLHKKKILSSKKFTKANKTKIVITNHNLQTYRNDSIPFIANTISHIDYSVHSSIDKEFQIEVTKYISQCSYPTSLICVYKGKVLGVGSSLGTDYPFNYRANVGSTLKPFIYTFLRENGIRKDALFSTKSIDNALWDIREVEPVHRDFLSLKEALKLSNNNAFVNASYKIGIGNVQSFLAKTFNQQIDNFVPASILGATINGITLYELAITYYNHFKTSNNSINKECISILKEVANDKFANNIFDVFIKTGTTNKNKERYGIVGMGGLLLGFLRQGNEVNDYSKEGNYLFSIMGFLKSIRNKIYKWD